MANYRHARDTDTKGSIEPDKVDDQISWVVHPLALAFQRSGDLDNTFRNLVADILRQFLGTHEYVRLLLRRREENPAGLADAMSLTREQVEKVYVVALLLEDPEG